MFQDMATHDQIERPVAQRLSNRLGWTADVESPIDIGPFGEVDADEMRSIAKTLGSQRSPIAFVSIQHRRPGPDLQDTRSAAAHGLGDTVEQQLDFARGA